MAAKWHGYRSTGEKEDGWSNGMRARGGDLVLSLPGCVCPKVKDMGPFWASRE